MTPRSAARELILRGFAGLRLDRLQRRVARRRAERLERSVVQAVLLHGTPNQAADDLRRQVEWVFENYSVIDCPTLARWLTRPETLPRRDGRLHVLFTFDDGLESQFSVAAPILESLGARGLFFAVPGFSLSEGEQARRFFSERIAPGADTSGWPEELWRPMRPPQLEELAARGHSIGNHTFSHARLDRIGPSEQSREIVESAELLETWIKQPVQAFAWTFSWEAIDRNACKLARERHPLCFSPCPGSFELSPDPPQPLWRTHVEASYPPHAYRFMYSGLANAFWVRQRGWLRDLFADAESERGRAESPR
jgi:peptidoglycan/xylan/chitin deacetylase (PgdA/CDA1 family)